MRTQDPAPATPDSKPPRVVQLPRFVLDQEIGLGAAVTRLAGAVGWRACGGCAARARWLDGRVAFAPRR